MLILRIKNKENVRTYIWDLIYLSCKVHTEKHFYKFFLIDFSPQGLGPKRKNSISGADTEKRSVLEPNFAEFEKKKN